ncbi:MAG: thioredoxin-dependent thiol peroxidase [Candidatus Marinimicrobia bacterium]|nr:thioredoxin-dependent thiol peroxidase [Candidatus Neomarinimicrobiota bacterium]|tara:strand:- start:235 stop:690 length:456 start_codon:yes stop_codon:yes gene_type:complete
MLKEGIKAPNFSLEDQNGDLVKLKDFEGKKVLLWFYPKASTPGCTIEGQRLRDEFQNFKQANTVVLGMSADTVKSQNNFCNKQNFPFQLLSDTEKTTIRAYEAIGMKKMYGREYEGIFRISYLIDEKGIIEKVYSKVKPKEHASEVLKDIS